MHLACTCTVLPTPLRPALHPTSGPHPHCWRTDCSLTVLYPSTREDILQYSISMSPSLLSRRQTGQQPLPVTDLITPTSGSAEVALGPGTYSVAVTVTNQHGSTMSEPQEVTVPGQLIMALSAQLSVAGDPVVCLLMTVDVRNSLVLRCMCFSNSATSPPGTS